MKSATQSNSTIASWFANLKVGRKFSVAFTVVGAVTAVTSLLNLQQLRALHEEASTVTDRWVPAITASSDLQRAVAVYRTDAKGQGFLEQTFESWQRNIEVNITGPYHICRNVVPLMKARGWGRIVNFSGIAPFLGHGAAKAMAKVAIIGFTRGLATEFAPFGITANCIGPGTIGTERETHLTEKKLFADQPVRRLGTPDEVAELAVYLSSKQAAFITGQCYLINGGLYYL